VAALSSSSQTRLLLSLAIRFLVTFSALPVSVLSGLNHHGLGTVLRNFCVSNSYAAICERGCRDCNSGRGIVSGSTTIAFRDRGCLSNRMFVHTLHLFVPSFLNSCRPVCNGVNTPDSCWIITIVVVADRHCYLRRPGKPASKLRIEATKLPLTVSQKQKSNAIKQDCLTCRCVRQF